MSYDFQYYSGEMLRMPEKPVKPRLERNPSSIEARAYADALEGYEREMKSYNENLGWYRSEKKLLLQRFQEELRTDFDLSESEFSVLWDEAYKHARSGNLSEVYHEFNSLHDLFRKYMLAHYEKGSKD
jgi:hypothetical protein